MFTLSTMIMVTLFKCLCYLETYVLIVGHSHCYYCYGLLSVYVYDDTKSVLCLNVVTNDLFIVGTMFK